MAEAWTWINRCPSCGSGFGTSSRVRAGGLEGSGRVRTSAFIVDILISNSEISVLAIIALRLLLALEGNPLE